MSRKTLLVMRHAKSSWRTDGPDIRRPLSGRGTRDALVAGQVLTTFDIDVVLCSAATRAQQTWQEATAGGASAGSVRVLESLYHAGTDQTLGILREVPASARTVLLIGHEPVLSDLITSLAISSKLTAQVESKFPTSGLAVLAHERDWDELEYGSATLTAFEVPRS